MSHDSATRLMLLALVILLVAWDLAVGYQDPQATISVVLNDLFHRHPIIVFSLGVVVGHVLWKI